MTATPDQGEVVLFGTAENAPDDGEVGAVSALAPGSCVVVMATVGPGAVERWGTRLAEREVALVDAPVSGGTARARAGRARDHGRVGILTPSTRPGPCSRRSARG